MFGTIILALLSAIGITTIETWVAEMFMSAITSWGVEDLGESLDLIGAFAISTLIANVILMLVILI